MNRTIKIGISPCPNDTFTFDALLNAKIDTGEYKFEVFVEDVELLNKRSIDNQLDITKLSFGAYPWIADNYVILDSGSALGFGVGPVLVAREKCQLNQKKYRIGIPGKYTTANLLMSILFPEQVDKEEYLFSEIASAVKSGKVDLGLLIHEGRFTYEDLGLKLIHDLGELWYKKTTLPIPLGCIVASRDLGDKVSNDINNLIRLSLNYALEHGSAISDFVKDNAQEMNDDVIKKHIDLYVNEYSLDLGIKGKEVVKFMLKEGANLRVIPQTNSPIFIE